MSALRTQEELMEKIEAAIKSGNSDNERTGAKWALFRGLEVAPLLSREMIDLLYDTDDVTEEMLKFVDEHSGEDYSSDDIDFTNVHEITGDYLYCVEKEMLSEKLYERAEKELAQFIQELRTDIVTPGIEINNETIIGRAYRLTVMNEMRTHFEDEEAFNTDDFKALLTLDEPLDYLYERWLDCDANIKDDIIGMVRSTLYELVEKTEDAERGYLDEAEGEDDMER